jgi:hypothetical protein
MAANNVVLWIGLVLVVAIAVGLGVYFGKDQLKSLFASEMSSPYQIASYSGVEIFDSGRGDLQTVTDPEARVLLEGAASGRPEPRLSVAQLVDFANSVTQPAVNDVEAFEDSDLYPGTARSMKLDTIDEAPKRRMYGSSADEDVEPNELVDAEVYADETPLTDQGHAGGIVPISLALQTNYGKQEMGSAYQLASRYNPAPSREECAHLCLDGGFGPRVDQCDCTGYIEPTNEWGPLERRRLERIN